MKTLYKFLIIACVALVSCEEVIDIDVKETEFVPIIEARLIGTDSLIHVKISKTTNYLGGDKNQLVTDASLSLNTPGGESIEVPHVGNGIYQASVVPQNFADYTLDVTVDGETFSATTQLRDLVPIDSLAPYNFPAGNPPPEVGRLFGTTYTDPANQKNYYHIIRTLNGVKGGDISVFNDVAASDSSDVAVIFIQGVQTGDSLTMELRSITPEAYRYYKALADLAGGSTDVAAPGNPESNWGLKAGGFFNAYNYDRAHLVVPKP